MFGFSISFHNILTVVKAEQRCDNTLPGWVYVKFLMVQWVSQTSWRYEMYCPYAGGHGFEPMLSWTWNTYYFRQNHISPEHSVYISSITLCRGSSWSHCYLNLCGGNFEEKVIIINTVQRMYLERLEILKWPYFSVHSTVWCHTFTGNNIERFHCFALYSVLFTPHNINDWSRLLLQLFIALDQ